MLRAESAGAAGARFLSSPLHDVFRTVTSAAALGEVIPLHVGEPAFPPPAGVAWAVAASFSNGGATYCDAAGLPSLRGVLAERRTRGSRRRPTAEQVIVTPGSTQGLYALLTALACPGDEVLLPVPYWPVYVQQCAALGLRARFYEVSTDGRIDIDQVSARLGPRTAAVLVNSPSNPSGAILSRATLEQLLAVTAPRGVSIISDEAYEDFVFAGTHESLASIEAEGDDVPRVWSIHTFSKTFALTGLRVGYVVAPGAREADRLVRVQEACLVCPSTPAQHGALAAMAAREVAVKVARDHLARVRARVLGPLVDNGLLASPTAGGWYAMCAIPDWAKDSKAYATTLLREHGVGVAPGQSFVMAAADDGPSDPRLVRSVRIALCGDPDSAEAGVKRLCEAAQLPPGGG